MPVGKKQTKKLEGALAALKGKRFVHIGVFQGMLPASQSHPSCVPCGYCPSPIHFAEQWLFAEEWCALRFHSLILQCSDLPV